MGLLDKLWDDDTLEGPKPEIGLGKLRKFASFSFRSNSGKAESQVGSSQSSFQEEATGDGKRVTRSIMIIKPPSTGHGQTESTPVSPAGVTPPVSPAGGTPPLSPFAGGGGREALRFRRRSATFAYERASGVGPYTHTPPPPYDI